MGARGRNATPVRSEPADEPRNPMPRPCVSPASRHHPGHHHDQQEPSMSTRLDPALFRPEAISSDTAQLNQQLTEMLTGLPEWWVVGAEATREARRRGEGPFPVSPKSPRAGVRTITGKEGN